MLTKVTEKFNNILKKQEDSTSLGQKTGQQKLFEQFSDILDKIATTLDRAKHSSKDQSIIDMSNALSQAAAAIANQKPVIPEPKPISVYKLDDRQKDQQEKPSVTEQEGTETSELQTTNNNSQTLINKQDSTSEAKEAEHVEDCQVIKETAKLLEQEVSSDSQSQVNEQQLQLLDQEIAVDTDVQANSEDTKLETEQTDQLNLEATNTQEADLVLENEAPSEEQAVNALDRLVTNVEFETNTTTENINVSQNAKQVNAPENHQPRANAEAVLLEPQETNNGNQSNREFAAQVLANIEVKLPQNDKKVVTETKAAEVVSQNIIEQSAQLLLAQIFSSASLRKSTDISTLQKLVNASQANQSSQSVNNNQLVGAPIAQQDKSAHLNRDRMQSREIPKPLALRTMERVESVLKEVARSKDGKTISLRLDPLSLGSLKIDVTIKDSQLHARFIAETAQVSALLRDQSHELQQMLRRAGVQADKIIISVASEHQASLSEQFSTFDREASQNSRGFNHGSERTNTGGGQAGQSGITQAVQQPLDHWVA